MPAESTTEKVQIPEAREASPSAINERANTVLRMVGESQLVAEGETGVKLALIRGSKLPPSFQLLLSEPAEKPGYQKFFSFEWGEKNQIASECLVSENDGVNSRRLFPKKRVGFTPEDYDSIHAYLFRLENLARTKNV